MIEYAGSVVVIAILLGATYGLYLRKVKTMHSEAKGILLGDSSYKVLILSATMGGGHEAAGWAVQAELERIGHYAMMVDGLRTMSRTLNWLLVWGYRSQVRNTPRSLGIVFAATSRKVGAAAVRSTVALLFANQLLKVVRKERPDLVVSTYPLITATLERLRKNGHMRMPAVAVIADYGVHPLWVAPGVDLHLVVSHQSAELVRRAGGRVSLARLPVAPEFHSVPTPKEARAALGLPQEAFVALIVGGAWGIGDLQTISKRIDDADADTIAGCRPP